MGAWSLSAGGILAVHRLGQHEGARHATPPVAHARRACEYVRDRTAIGADRLAARRRATRLPRCGSVQRASRPAASVQPTPDFRAGGRATTCPRSGGCWTRGTAARRRAPASASRSAAQRHWRASRIGAC